MLRRIGLRRLARHARRDLIPIFAIHLPGASHEPLTLETTHARWLRCRHTSSPACSTETLEPEHAARTRHHLARHATRRARRRLTDLQSAVGPGSPRSQPCWDRASWPGDRGLMGAYASSRLVTALGWLTVMAVGGCVVALAAAALV